MKKVRIKGRQRAIIFNYAERIEYLHCIEVETEDEELFNEVADDIADEMYGGCNNGTEMALSKFFEVFGTDKVTFKEDRSGTVEYEEY